MREQLAAIRAEFEALLAENAARPEAERLPREVFEIDPGLRAMVAEGAAAREEEARLELAWDTEKRKLALAKIKVGCVGCVCWLCWLGCAVLYVRSDELGAGRLEVGGQGRGRLILSAGWQRVHYMQSKHPHLLSAAGLLPGRCGGGARGAALHQVQALRHHLPHRRAAAGAAGGAGGGQAGVCVCWSGRGRGMRGLC